MAITGRYADEGVDRLFTIAKLANGACLFHQKISVPELSTVYT